MQRHSPDGFHLLHKLFHLQLRTPKIRFLPEGEAAHSPLRLEGYLGRTAFHDEVVLRTRRVRLGKINKKGEEIWRKDSKWTTRAIARDGDVEFPFTHNGQTLTEPPEIFENLFTTEKLQQININTLETVEYILDKAGLEIYDNTHSAALPDESAVILNTQTGT
jgi:hypothetical protein